MLSRRHIALGALVAATVNGAVTTQLTAAGEVCGGASSDGKIYIGKTNGAVCNSVATAPTEYISMQVDGMAFLKTGWDWSKATAAATTANWVTVVEPAKKNGVVMGGLKMDMMTAKAAEGCQTADKADGTGSCSYGRAIAGTWVGDAASGAAAKKFGFVGTASYLMVSGSIKTNVNSFLVAIDVANPATTQTIDNVCISALNGAACGAQRTYNTGAYKFSLYGYVNGADYKAWAAGYSHFGFKQTVDITKMPTVTFTDAAGATKDAAWAVNGGKIKSMKLVGAATQLDWTFPLNYNVGTVDANGKPTPKKSKSVDIYAKMKTGSTTQVELYYVFSTADGMDDALGYVVYDPEVKPAAKGAGGAGVAAAGASTLTGVVAIAMTLAALMQ